MLKCSENDYHKITPIYWDKSERKDVAKNFLCQYCFRIFSLEEISDRHSRMCQLEKEMAD